MRRIFIITAMLFCIYAFASATTVSLSFTPLTCNGNTSVLTVTTSGIAGTLSYSLNGGAPQAGNTFNVTVGSYTVVVSDGTNQYTGSTVVTPNANNFVITPTVTNVACNGGTGSASVSVSDPAITFDGLINEVGWGSPRATNAGGPGYGFGAGHELNALYATSTATDLYLALGGDVQNNNRIIVWIDCKSGGYNNGSYNRTGAPAGVNNFNSATTFDPGFDADYALAIGSNGLHNNFFFDLFPLTSSGGGAVYLGDNSSANLEGAPGASGSQTAGFEVKIPWSSLGGVPTGNFKVFAMYMSDGGFLSNQFLQRAGSSDGNYGNGAVTFGAATPDPVTLQPFAITWSTGLNTNASSTSTITAVNAGTYTVTVSNTGGCTSTSTITITQPAALNASASSTPILCHGNASTVTVGAMGGTSPYTGTGSFTVGANSYTYTVTDANNCASTTAISITQPALFLIDVTPSAINCSGQSSAVSITGTGGTLPYNGVGVIAYPAGTHTITVSDANNCQDAQVITLSQPTPLVASVSATPILCNGGVTTITVGASGGTAPYTGLATTTYNAGSYSFTVTDTNGCSATVNVNVTEPPLLYITASQISNVNCGIGTADVQVDAYDGTPGYVGAGIIQKPIGNHTITVTDTNGCVATAAITVTGPSAIAVTANTTPIACNGGNSNVTISATGGSGTYTMGVGSSSVAAGSYTATVTDNAGCTGSAVYTITEPTALVLTASATNVLCNGGNGNLSFSATGGTAMYNFLVNGFSQLSPLPSVAGNYTIMVADANNCTLSTTVTITEPTPLVPTYSFAPIACNGGSTILTLGATGGIPPYLSTGPTPAQAGPYYYTANDSHNCMVSVVITITEPPVLSVSVAANNNPLNAGSPLQLTASNPTGVVATNVWNLPAGGTFTGAVYNTTATGTSAGIYTITATNATGCTATTTISISVNASVKVAAKAMLAGPFSSANSLMSDSLRNGLLPLTEPYSVAPYAASFVHVNGGGESILPTVLSVQGNDAIVDWVFIQLRSASNSAQVVATRSALIQRDGDIVDVDGTSPVEFTSTVPGNYFIAIRHRNHIGCMTASAMALSGAQNSVIDFASSTGAAVYTNPAITNAPLRTIGAVRALYGGNCSIASTEAARLSYGTTSVTDRSKLLAATGTSGSLIGYSIFDCDLNGIARFNGGNPDRLVILSSCGGINTNVINQHLP
jgi:large repetitive protein